MTIKAQDITAVILAGGQGRRMGGQDKGLLDFNGRPLVAILIEKLERQAVDIVINANRNLPRYEAFGYRVVNDQLEDYQGPLAGFASAMNAVESDFILTLPCDGPLLADDYVARFIARHEQTGAPVIVAFDGERLQPVHALISTGLQPSLNQFLATGDRKIDRWYALHDYVQADFSDCADMFRNINTPSDQQSMQGSP
ncbi:MAG: molybdenum cofactor guanylyltransferase [Gammaproteobacteria bacterium]|nr:molybdenum cofactor guanylyltransferase [Gammaproteobacteria bacterium]MDH3534851.1 molybdenum cofactor guanylyltransferase [Gammaproteobacteria bacterium]